MANKQYNPNTFAKAAARNDMMAQGGYDGRFQGKTFKDKKKDQDKREARNWKQNLRSMCY